MADTDDLAAGEVVLEIAVVDEFTPALRRVTASLDILADVRCGVTELIRSQCDHCRPPALVDEETAALRARLRRRGWELAHRAGICVGCGFPFPPGVAVRRPAGRPPRESSEDRFVAECCAKNGGDEDG